MRAGRARRWLLGACGLVLLPVLALLITALLEPLPVALRAPPETSREIYDRNGRLLRVVRTTRGELAAPVRLGELSLAVVPALLAAEDARFYWHPGVDPLAVLRAGGQALGAGQLVSGASTLTQQLARTLVPRPRTLRGKWREMAIALRIEAELDKTRILEEYLSRVEFGPNLRGIEAASQHYFDKPARELSLAEAAALVSIPRGPTLYDPRRGLERLQRRRDRVLGRMQSAELADAAAIERALATPLQITRRLTVGGVEHLTTALAQGRLGADSTSPRLDATLDSELQREVETLCRQAARELERNDASALAVLVADNESGEVLAYVGSPDFLSSQALGQNDGTQALRQPGSTLKPFVYAAALAEGGMTAATLLPDVELYLADGQDVYAPKNYDRKSHGPVRLREALGSSLNVPAVWTADRVGVERVLGTLRQFGFASLREEAEHYGPALALGDGEVRLSELVAAYATLARGGLYRPLRYLRGGEPVAERRVLDERLAALVTDILSDREARAAGFGLDGTLALPFPVAAKTGTSKGLRDNWTLGYTRAISVGVWVGNFDGRPLVRSSGITGAAPLFREVMLAAMRARSGAPLLDRKRFSEREVCALSGGLAHADCPHRVRELFVPGQEPHESCDMHERVRVDRATGLRAGPACRDAEEQVFERYPEEYSSWAAQAGRPLAPAQYAPRCPGPAVAARDAALSVVFPTEGARFAIDALGHERQEIVLEARAASGASLTFVLDGQRIGETRGAHRLPWRLRAGKHSLELRQGASHSARVSFEVR
jgi:penicillin-binding protein 1C